MSPRSPKENARIRQESIRAILRGALEMFAEKGFHAATTAEIAERAGVSKGLIYSYFSSKEELLRATIQERLSEALQRMSEIPEGLTPRERLRFLASQLVDLGADKADPMRLYLLLLLQPGASEAIKAVTEPLRADFARYYGILQSTVAELGHPRPLAATLALHSALNGIMLNLVIQPELLAHPDKYPLEEMLDLLVDSMTPEHGRARVDASETEP